MPSSDAILILRLKVVFFHLTENFGARFRNLGSKQNIKMILVLLATRMIPALAFATPTYIPYLFHQLFAQLPSDAYDLALYFESTYIGRHMANSPMVIPSTFSLDMWNYHVRCTKVSQEQLMLWRDGMGHSLHTYLAIIRQYGHS